MPLAVDMSKVQVNNFQKAFFVHHLIKEFEQKNYWTLLMCIIICQIFDKMSEKIDFLKIINLYYTYLQ